MKIVMLERLSVGSDIDVSCFDELGEVVAYDNTVSVEEVAERIADADAVISNKAPLNAVSMKDAPNVKFIGVAADANSDGDIDIADAVHIVNYVVGKIPALAPRFEWNLPEPE